MLQQTRLDQHEPTPLRVVLANPRGFCAGVVRAIDIVEQALDRQAAAEIVADGVFLGHADAAVHLDGALRHVAARLADAHLGLGDLARTLGGIRLFHHHGRQHRHAAALLHGHEHVRQPVLHHLITADRLAELLARLAVVQRHRVHRFHRADAFRGSGGDARLDHALHDLGLLLAHSWQQPHAWLCWDIARRVYPQHPMLKEIAARERILQSRYPDFF